MARSEPVVIPFPTPANPLHGHIADNCAYQAAAEYRAALLAKLLKRMPQRELADTTNALLSELVVLYRQAIVQAHGGQEHG